MTQSGEKVTQNGEFRQNLESVFLYNRSIEVSYRTLIDARGSLEIRLNHQDEVESETFQMIFVLKGNLQVTKAGSKTICAEIGSHQHNLCRLPFNSARMLVDVCDDMVFINISNNFLKRFLPLEHPAYVRLFNEDMVENPFPLASVNMCITPEIRSVLQKLSGLCNSTFSDQLLLESKTIELLALQIVQFELLESKETPDKLKKIELERMYEAREILVNQTSDKLSLRALAHLVGTNEFNLKRDFKALFGKTVFNYLSEYKMEKAKSMLIDENITVAEIAKRMGYKHATHFTSAFKRYFGFLPNKLKAGKLSLLIFSENFIALLENFNFMTI